MLCMCGRGSCQVRGRANTENIFKKCTNKPVKRFQMKSNGCRDVQHIGLQSTQTRRNTGKQGAQTRDTHSAHLPKHPYISGCMDTLINSKLQKFEKMLGCYIDTIDYVTGIARSCSPMVTIHFQCYTPSCAVTLEVTNFFCQQWSPVECILGSATDLHLHCFNRDALCWMRLAYILLSL